MQIRPREILTYITPSGRDSYQQWYTQIRDQKAQIAISNRIARLRIGNFGDFKRLSSGLYELRIRYGPGYRVYLGLFQHDIILLCGGTKGTQQRDIDRAQNYWSDFLEHMKEESQ